MMSIENMIKPGLLPPLLHGLGLMLMVSIVVVDRDQHGPSDWSVATQPYAARCNALLF